MGRPGRKDTGQGPVFVPARVYLQKVAISLVKPGDQDHFIAHGNTFKPLNNRRIHFEPGVGSTFKSLVGRRHAIG